MFPFSEVYKMGLQKMLPQPGHGTQTVFVGQLLCTVQGSGWHSTVLSLAQISKNKRWQKSF